MYLIHVVVGIMYIVLKAANEMNEYNANEQELSTGSKVRAENT